MSLQSLDVSALPHTVVEEYERFATSFTRIHAQDVRDQIAALYAGARYWPEALLQINPDYQPGLNVEAIVTDGKLHPSCADVFRAAPDVDAGRGDTLHLHERQPVDIATLGESDVATMGTGSGESLRMTRSTADFAELADPCVCFASGAGVVLSIGVPDGQRLPLPGQREDPLPAQQRAPHPHVWDPTP